MAKLGAFGRPGRPRPVQGRPEPARPQPSSTDQPRTPRVEIDSRLLARAGIFTPESTINRTAEEFRLIKRAVLERVGKARADGVTNANLVMVTSTREGEGKTFVALNLAFSLSHQPDVKTVLVDLDLRRPAIAKEIGLGKPQSMASVLQGTRPVAENFVRYGETLAIGTNATPVYGSSELLLNAATAGGVAALKAAFGPSQIRKSMCFRSILLR